MELKRTSKPHGWWYDRELNHIKPIPTQGAVLIPTEQVLLRRSCQINRARRYGFLCIGIPKICLEEFERVVDNIPKKSN
jgi:hypothetical protein